MKNFIFFLSSLFFLLPEAQAAAGGFVAKDLFFQLLNFSIFAGLTVFLARKPLQKLYHKRQEGFLSFERQVLDQGKKIEAEQKMWEEKFSSLNKKHQGIQQEALRRGENFSQRKQGELKSLKERLKRELDFFIHLEKEKAKRALLEKWQIQLTESLRADFQKQALQESFQKSWIKSFLNRESKAFLKLKESL